MHHFNLQHLAFSFSFAAAPWVKDPIVELSQRINAEAMRTKTENGGSNVNLERLMEDIKVVVRDGQELLKSGYSGVKEQAIERARITDRAVRAHPYQTLGIVFGAGVLVGVLAYALCTGESGMEEI